VLLHFFRLERLQRGGRSLSDLAQFFFVAKELLD
jgi:hypothetical protein